MIAEFEKIKNSFWQKTFFPLFLLVLIILTIGFLIVSNWKISQKRKELILRIEDLKKEIQISENRQKELNDKIFPSEFFLEKEAREKLNLKKPGEEVIVVLSPEKFQLEKELKKENFLEKIAKLITESEKKIKIFFEQLFSRRNF